MKTRLAFVFIAAACAGSPVLAPAQTAEQAERVAASFVLALGRAPSAAEIDAWAKHRPLSIADLIARHRQHLQEDAATRQTTSIQAFQDAFGRAPTDDEIKASNSGTPAALTYTELMQRHLQWLAGNPADYEQVMHRAYRMLLRREAYAEEIEYWRKQEILSYALLVGCVEDWARRNQPGLMVTTGIATVSVNSEFLTTVRLSPAIAAEARVAAGLVPSGDAESARASGHNLVAAGAGKIATGGRMHFVAAGGVGLASFSSGNR